MGNFTQKAESIIQGAKAEAHARGNLCVDTVDILLSLLKNDPEQVAKVLPNAGTAITHSGVLEMLKRLCGSPPDKPWSERAQMVLENAYKNAKESMHDCGDVKDIIVGLLMTDGMTKRVLRELCPEFDPNSFLRSSKEKTESGTKQEIRVHIRWMIRRDMPEVLVIETSCFEFPWLEEDFIRCLKQRNCIGMVAEHSDHVVGFMIYELDKTRIHALNFAVAIDSQRRGVGTQMVAKLRGKLSSQRRNCITLEVRETNLSAQIFFRNCGFRAVSVLRDFYPDTAEGAILMQYRYVPEKEEISQNRIGHLAG